jgi:DNA-binding transcriptional MerR regulator
VEASWTLQDLVAEVATRIAALPAPRNGQVRAIPDDRTVRYYATIGLLDRPGAMRGRTALYGLRHVAQVVAIKRLQAMGRSLSEIQTLWPTLDDHTLARMSGVELPAAAGKPPVRPEFWKRGPTPSMASAASATEDVVAAAATPASAASPTSAAVELRLELAPSVVLSLSVVDESCTISPADVRALRVAAAPLLAELVSRRLTSHARGEEP